MDKIDCIKKIDNIIHDYCENSEEYEDISEVFSLSINGCFYNVKIELDREKYIYNDNE